jgi:hypothetical protein
MMVDTTKIADQIDGLADKEFKAGGFKLSIASIMAILAFLGTVVGGLYGGFVLFQRIEAVAGLDLDEYQQQMQIMDAKVSGISVKVEESVEYTRDIKNGLRSDILNIEKQSDRVEDTVRIIEDNVDNLLREYEAKVRKLMDSNMSDTRTLIDNADKRFENQRERVRISQNSEMKELEEKLIDKLQRALDNPLAD